MKNFTLAILFVSFVLIAKKSNAQQIYTDIQITVPEVALMDIETSGASKNISFTFLAPTDAGMPITVSGPNTDLWLNYSVIESESAFPPVNTKKKVTVELSQATNAIDVKVAAATYSGAGEGKFGTSAAAELTLSTTPQAIVTGIGSSYTGTGSGNGHQLTYSVIPKTGSYQYLTERTEYTAARVIYTIAAED